MGDQHAAIQHKTTDWLTLRLSWCTSCCSCPLRALRPLLLLMVPCTLCGTPLRADLCTFRFVCSGALPGFTEMQGWGP